MNSTPDLLEAIVGEAGVVRFVAAADRHVVDHVAVRLRRGIDVDGDELVEAVAESLDEACLDVAYDITRPQPQLFVTPSFEALHELCARVEASLAASASIQCDSNK